MYFLGRWNLMEDVAYIWREWKTIQKAAGSNVDVNGVHVDTQTQSLNTFNFSLSSCSGANGIKKLLKLHPHFLQRVLTSYSLHHRLSHCAFLSWSQGAWCFSVVRLVKSAMCWKTHSGPFRGNEQSSLPTFTPLQSDWIWGYTQGVGGAKWRLDEMHGCFAVQWIWR